MAWYHFGKKAPNQKRELMNIEEIIHHVTIRVSVEEDYAPQSEVLFNVVRGLEVGSIKDGLTLQIGWAVYRLDAVGQGEFVVTTVDHTDDAPMHYVTDLTVPLRIQSQQLDLLQATRSLDKVDDTVTANDTIILAKGVLQSDHVYVERTPDVEPGDSGWYVGFVDESVDDADLYAVRTRELLTLRPELLQVLMLPYGYMVIFENWAVKEVLNAEDVLLLST